MTQENLALPGAQLARLYSIAVADPDGVPSYVAANGPAFESECTGNSFGRIFIEQLRTRALDGPTPDAVYDEAMQIASLAGAPQLGQQLAEDLMKDRTDLMLLAGYLEDLIRVIPALLQGDENPYRRTSLYAAMAFVWQNVSELVQPSFLQQLRQMTFELNEWYANGLMDGVRVDYLDSRWPRTAKTLQDSVDKYETAKRDGDGVQMVVYGAVILGTASQNAPLLGLSPDDVDNLHSGPNVDPLIDWLEDNSWIN